MKTGKRILCMAAAMTLLRTFLPIPYAAADADTRIIVSLGDSYSSGEGIEPFYGQEKPVSEKVLDDDWLAHRSAKSWPGLLRLEGVSGTMADHRGENWFFAAASGATTAHINRGFVKTYDQWGAAGEKELPPQIAVFDGLEPGSVDYVTLTLGGNDAGFASIITSAARTNGPEELSALLEDVWSRFEAEGGIRDSLRQSYYDIAEAAGSQTRIIVAGYPALLNPAGSTWVSAENAVLVNEAAIRFNGAIEQLVTECRHAGLNIYFAPVAAEFAGHEAATEKPYINDIIIFAQPQDIDRKALASSYSVHPNADGARAYARAVQTVIDALETSAWEETQERRTVSYQDENGVLRQTEAAVLSGDETVLAEGWYLAEGTLNANQAWHTEGAVHLILADDCALTLREITGEHALTVYGQANSTGSLVISGAAVTVGSYAQYGGSVRLNTVPAVLTGSSGITIAGGQLELAGSLRTDGTLTVALTGETDSLCAGSYSAAAVSVAAHTALTAPDLPKRLTEETLVLSGAVTLPYTGAAQQPDVTALTGLLAYRTTVYTGTLSAETLSALAGKRLCPYPADQPAPEALLTESDFTCSATDSAVDAGAYRCEIVGAGAYSGSAVIPWQITPAEVGGALAVSVQSPLIYDGEAFGADDLTLQAQTPAAQLLLDALETGEAMMQITVSSADGTPADGTDPGDYKASLAISGNANFEPVQLKLAFTVEPFVQAVPDETLCGWAEEDHLVKTGNAVQASVTGRSDGKITVTLTDADGGTADVYVIDAQSCIGTNSAGETVDLPQTGNTDKHDFTLTALACVLLAAGLLVMRCSRLLHR